MTRLPTAARFERLSFAGQMVMIHLIQAELDCLEEGLRSGSITGNRGRGAGLRDLRRRQQRLNNLADEFGYRRAWRKYVRVKAITEPTMLAAQDGCPV
jgi:hypothetical protein